MRASYSQGKSVRAITIARYDSQSIPDALMLKTIHAGKLWLVTQPDHSALAGYLAAHWGNAVFSRPGAYGAVLDPERLRAEAVFAIAEHDNGWWEWEANPDHSVEDGFPLGLGEVLKDQQAGMDRWRRGLARFSHNPMVNLLVSSHAYWLYAARALSQPDPVFTHPLFWKGAPEQLYPGSIEAPLAFMHLLAARQKSWIEELCADPATVAWTEPANLAPLVRLLQLCDGLSLALSSAAIPARSGATQGLGEDAFELRNVPRRSWDDRCTITVTPLGNRRIELDPFPFDAHPLIVTMPARIVSLPCEKPAHFHTWSHAHAREFVQFQLVART